MRPLLHKIKPASGFSSVLHIGFRLALPIIVFVLSSLSIGIWLPLLVVFLSKWRIFAVRPRFWPANLRANAVDIMVGVSIVIFMANSESLTFRLVWMIAYMVWLIVIKPSSTMFAVSLQAGLGLLSGLTALFLAWSHGPLWGLVFFSGLICYLAARHFFDSFNEPYTKLLSYLWGYFGAALTWVLGHLLVVYPKQNDVVAQPTLFLVTIAYALGAVYYLEHFDRLSSGVRKELLFLGSGIVLILLGSLFYEGLRLIV